MPISPIFQWSLCSILGSTRIAQSVWWASWPQGRTCSPSTSGVIADPPQCVHVRVSPFGEHGVEERPDLLAESIACSGLVFGEDAVAPGVVHGRSELSPRRADVDHRSSQLKSVGFMANRKRAIISLLNLVLHAVPRPPQIQLRKLRWRIDVVPW